LGQFANLVESFSLIEAAARHLGDMNGPKLAKIRRWFAPLLDDLRYYGFAAETSGRCWLLWGRYCELGSATTRNWPCDESQKIATLGNNLNADNGQYGGEDAEVLRDGVPNGKKKKKDKDDDQEIQAKH